MVLEAHVIMGTKRNPDIERSLQLLTKILEEHPDYIPALYGIAVAYVYLKQPPRARNYLKRIVKAEWKSDLADDFEKSWLLLADLYIQVKLSIVIFIVSI